MKIESKSKSRKLSLAIILLLTRLLSRKKNHFSEKGFATTF